MNCKAYSIGIDVGSSFLKVCIIDDQLRIRYSAKESLPCDFYCIGNDVWPIVVSLLSRLLEAKEFTEFPSATGIAVSAVVPCLVAVDVASRRIRIVTSHLLPTINSKNQAVDLGVRLASRRERTERAISSYPSLCERDAMLPLSTAIGFFLTGTVEFDITTLYELGYESRDSPIVTASQGLKAKGDDSISCLVGIPLMGVTSDTIASALGAGLRADGDGLVYYGTYYCAMDLRMDLHALLTASSLEKVPYTWVVSLPQFGRLVEKILLLLRFGNDPAEKYRAFEKCLESALSLQEPAEPCVELDFVAELLTLTLRSARPETSLEEVALAIASHLGLELNKVLRVSDRVPRRWFAAGGGSDCRPLLQRTSNLASIVQHKHLASSLAYGTAVLAMWHANGRPPALYTDCGKDFTIFTPQKQ